MLLNSTNWFTLLLLSTKLPPKLYPVQLVALPSLNYWLSLVDLFRRFPKKGYRAGKESMVVFKAFVADSFGPTICPSLPSFTPYFAFQFRPASTPSSFLQTAHRLVRDHLSKYLCKPLQQTSQAVFGIKFTGANRHSFFEFQRLWTALSFQGVLPINRFQEYTHRS